MLKIENVDVMGWEAAIRGMRNPMNSWDKSDSGTKCPYEKEACCGECQQNFCIGPNDKDLMKHLRNAGTDHRKFIRMITVYADITAPLYWWKEFDTYKVGTVANSCSTMHKIADKEFTLDDFSCEHLNKETRCLFEQIINYMNISRDCYNSAIKDKDTEWAKDYWWQMIQLLPSSYNQRRTVMLNYEVLANMYRSRKNHKLDEWHVLCDWIKTLPYSQLITGEFDISEDDNGTSD